MWASRPGKGLAGETCFVHLLSVVSVFGVALIVSVAPALSLALLSVVVAARLRLPVHLVRGTEIEPLF